MSFTNVFGGTTIFPSDVSYLALSVTEDVNLYWPLETTTGVDIAARIIDVTPSASGFSVFLPDATKTGAGQTILFNNVSPSYTLYVKDYDGNTLATLGTSSQWQFYLSGVSTAAGTWRVFQYGAAGSGAVQPSVYAGYGLTVTGSSLSTASPVTTFSTTGTTVSVANRAGVFVWTGSGAGTLNLPSVSTAGNNFFVLVRNSGGGVLTLDPAGGETINGASTLTLDPEDSAVVVTDGVTWYTIGLGQDPVFAFDYTSISVTGGTYTLSGSELNRIAYKFVGVLSSNSVIVVPATIQQYWVNNATTGSYTLSLQTAGGTPVAVGQNTRGIYYCDGSDIILADTASIALPLTIAQGGTGVTTASAARLALGITAFADAIVTATTAASVRTTIVAAASGANSDITSLSALSTPLSAAQGGTGIGSYAVGDLLYASGAAALSKLAGVATGNALISGGVTTAPSWGKIDLTTHVSGTLPVANGGTGITALGVGVATFLGTPSSANLAAAVTDETGSGALVFANSPTLVTPALGTPSAAVLTNATGLPLTTGITGTLPIANGGTGQTTANNALNALLPSQAANASKVLSTDGSNTSWIVAGGTVTSVDFSGGTTGLSATGGPITGSGTFTLTGTLAVANGGTGITSFGAGIATFLGTPSSANLAAAVTDETGSGALVFATSPTLVTPALGTPSALVLTNATALPLTTGVTGTLPVANGGTGGTTPATAQVVLRMFSALWDSGSSAFANGMTISKTATGKYTITLAATAASSVSWALVVTCSNAVGATTEQVVGNEQQASRTAISTEVWFRDNSSTLRDPTSINAVAVIIA